MRFLIDNGMTVTSQKLKGLTGEHVDQLRILSPIIDFATQNRKNLDSDRPPVVRSVASFRFRALAIGARAVRVKPRPAW